MAGGTAVGAAWSRPTLGPRLGVHVADEALCRQVLRPFVAVQVRPALDELTDDRIGRVPDLFHGSHLPDLAVVEHRDPATDRVRAPHVVRYDDGRDTELLAHPDHQLVDDRARDRVETRGRFIVEDVLRAKSDRAGDTDALPHAAGQLRRVAVDDSRKIDEIQRLHDALMDLVLGELLLFPQSHRHVVADGERVEEGGELEDVADPRAQRIEISAAQARHLEVIHEHLAGVRLEEANDVFDRHRLARA
jgi:hypothetical protein